MRTQKQDQNISDIVGELEVVERCGDKDYDKFLSNLLVRQSSTFVGLMIISDFS